MRVFRTKGSCLLVLLVLPSVAGALSPDETVLLEKARAIAAAPIDDFTPLGGTGFFKERDPHYRYQLAFLGYGLCSIVAGEPDLRPEVRTIFQRFVEKMQRPKAVAFWKALGFEGDGMTNQNAMYRGHLNLMYALAHDRFGITNFDASFHDLSGALFKEIGGERPICCEPDRLFIQCNAVAVLSLYLHDRAFATDYASAGPRLLAWAQKNMPLQKTKLICDDYRPSTCECTARTSGYANAWTIAFLSPVPALNGKARAMYSDWRRVFAEPFPLLGVVRGAPATEELSLEETLTSGLQATTFGLLAAREMGDQGLHLRLEWTVSYVEQLVTQFEWMLPPTKRVQARTFKTVALFARTFRGWNEVLELKKN